MVDSRLRLLLATALIFVMTALSALQTLADAGVEISLLPDGMPILELDVPVATPTLVPFSERLEAAGSVEALVASAPDGWVPVAASVDYQLFKVAGPNNIHVARMERANANLFLETSLGQGRLNGGVERVSNMFARFEGAINYWGSTWGGTNDVLVAINGSFFDASGVPDRGFIQSGWYAKRFTNNQTGSGFVWKQDRTAIIGQCVTHNPTKQVITYLSDVGSDMFQGINVSRGSNELIVYTPQFDKTTQTDNTGVEILVQLERPTMVLPPPNMAIGTVREIRDLAGNSPLYFDYVVLSATGEMRTKLLETLQVGDQVGISNSITSYESDCVTPLAVDWTKAYASLGGSYYFLQDGTITSPGPTPANPLTAIAFSPDYIFFIVVDGRDPGISVGMTIDALASFVKNTLGATYGINQDGGGSSTMVIDGVVVNLPSDLTPVACNNVYLPIIIKSPGTNGAAHTPSEEIEAPECFEHNERSVSNGMMIVSYQPKSLSTAFFENQAIVALSEATIRLGPGSNYASVGSVPGGTGGTIQVHPGGLNGVYAKGTNWWLVNFGGVVGWVSEGVINP